MAGSTTPTGVLGLFLLSSARFRPAGGVPFSGVFFARAGFGWDVVVVGGCVEVSLCDEVIVVESRPFGQLRWARLLEGGPFGRRGRV